MRRTRQIEGWFSPDAAALIALLDEAQLTAGVRGNIFEIGVHHGRSAVFLCALARGEERLGVCDLFGEQVLNVSASGSGNRAIFEANIAAEAPGFTRLDIFAKPSYKLIADEIGRPHRLFHIDGGHLCEEALTDLRLGAAVLHDQGAIIVDDPFRADWPGVTEAILDFLAERPEFRPMIVGFNKLVIVPTAAAGIYESLICDSRMLWRYFDKHVFQMKQLPMAGRDTYIMLVPTWRQCPELDRNVARLVSLCAGLLYGALRHLPTSVGAKYRRST